jgi:hypothetical protein
MVNDGFRRAPNYGFEMVDALTAVRTANAVNRKFTPNRSSRFAGEFRANLPHDKHLRFIEGC